MTFLDQFSNQFIPNKFVLTHLCRKQCCEMRCCPSNLILPAQAMKSRHKKKKILLLHFCQQKALCCTLVKEQSFSQYRCQGEVNHLYSDTDQRWEFQLFLLNCIVWLSSSRRAGASPSLTFKILPNLAPF